jgi:hypothetical protein
MVQRFVRRPSLLSVLFGLFVADYGVRRMTTTKDGHEIGGEGSSSSVSREFGKVHFFTVLSLEEVRNGYET